MKLQN